MKGYKLKAFMKTPKGKATLGLTGAAVLGAAAVMYPLFGTDSVVNVDERVFKNDRNKYSQESVMANVKLYKDGVFVPEVKEEGTSDAGGGVSSGGVSGAESFDPSTTSEVNSGGGSVIVPDTSTGGGKAVATLSFGMKLYDGQTKKGDVRKLDKLPDGYKPHGWVAYEGDQGTHGGVTNPCWDLLKNKTCDKLSSGTGYVNSEGRLYVAVGPALTQEGFKCSSSKNGIYASQVYQYQTFDVVLEKDGNTYYLPCVSGDCKAHTWNTGIMQSGAHVNSGGDASIMGGVPGSTDRSIVEFIGSGYGSYTSELNSYEIKNVIVYKEN